MAIDSVNNSAISQLLYPTSNAVSGSSADADSSTDGPRASGGASGPGGRIFSAISAALTQIGVTPADASSASDASTSASQDPAQAAQAFATALFGALHDQGEGAKAASGDGVPKAGGGGHHHHGGGGGGGKVEGGLQQLIESLGSVGTSAGSDQSSLQTAFAKLVTANGGSADNASLSSFLQNLAQDLHGAPPAGNVVSTVV